MMRASEAWQIMTEGTRFSDRRVDDDDPRWVDFCIRYAESERAGRDKREDAMMHEMVNLCISELRRYPREMRPCKREILMAIFGILREAAHNRVISNT